MRLKKKILITGMILATIAPVAAQAGGIFKTQRIVWNHEFDGAEQDAPPYQRYMMENNPCLGQAAKAAKDSIENNSAYASALQNYHKQCTDVTIADPVFTITADYEPVPNSSNYSLAIGVSVKYANSARHLWGSNPSYVVPVGATLPGNPVSACPDISQWQRQVNIASAQTQILNELAAETKSCAPAGNAHDNGADDGFDAQPRHHGGAKADGNGVVVPGCFGPGCGANAHQPQ